MAPLQTRDVAVGERPPTRRQFLLASSAAALASMVGACHRTQPAPAAPTEPGLTRARRDAMTPDSIIEDVEAGNARFRSGRMRSRDYRAEQRATAGGQYPEVVILSCIDSRGPAETILDLGIGDVFNSRVAGPVVSDDVLGSLEFACRIAGAKVVVVMGHTDCGAVKGAIDGGELGNLTGLVAKIRPAVQVTATRGPRTSKNADFVDAVARTHVGLTIASIRQQSSVLAELESHGALRMIGSLYDVRTGAVHVL